MTGVSARKEIENIAAVHFLKQHNPFQLIWIIYRALECPFVEEWEDRHREYLALLFLRKPAPLIG